MKKTQLKVRGEVTGRRHSKETQEEDTFGSQRRKTL